MKFEQAPSATAKAAAGLGKIIAVAIILGVTGLGDVMYIQLMSSKFPAGGPLLVFCYVGAFASFMAMGYLLIGKTISFRPGAQTIAAWSLLVAELLMCSLNIMLVFSGIAHLSGFMAVWLGLAPATPVIVMAGVVVVFMLDPELKQKHENMEMQDQINKAEREFQLLQHRAELEIRMETLKLTKGFLLDELQQADNLDVHRGIASQMYANILSGFAGMNIAPRRQISRVSTPVQKELAPPTPIRKERDTDPAITPLRFEQSAEVDDRPLA